MSAGSSIGGAASPVGGGLSVDALLGVERREPESRFGEISSEDFINLILAELTNQDPTEPQDTQALLDQISAIRSIESDTSMIDRLSELIDHSSFASASNLIGAVVRGVSEQGEVVTDLVFSVSQTREGSVLNLVNGERVPIGSVLEVGAPVIADEPAPAEDEGPQDADEEADEPDEPPAPVDSGGDGGSGDGGSGDDGSSSTTGGAP